jgi:HSP20 family protein
MFDDWLEREGMRIEEQRKDDELVIRAELPGIDPEEDVDITVEDSTLTIAAERRHEATEGSKEEGTFRSEFRYGRFVRRLPLPKGATEEDVQATYVDGILEIHVPVGDEAPQPKKVPVSRG